MNLVLAIDHLGGGGAQRQAVEIARALAREDDVTVRVLVYHALDFFAPRLADSGVQVVSVEKRRRFDPTMPLRMARLLRELAPDVVYALMPPPAAWTLAALRLMPAAERPAFVAGDRSMGVTVTRTQALVQPHLYRRADALTVNAECAVQTLQRRVGLARERIHYLPNGIDLAAWDAAGAGPCPLPLAPGEFHAVLVGRIEPEKDHALVLEALTRLAPEARAGLRVWFVGAASRGDAHAAGVHAEIERRGLGEQVRIVPPLREIPALLRRAGALLLTSRFEGFPNVLLEAMASGLPSIATRVGDVPNMLADEKSGILIEPGDAGALASALARLRALPAAERSAMGARARAAVEARYQIADVARRYLELFRGLAERRRTP